MILSESDSDSTSATAPYLPPHLMFLNEMMDNNASEDDLIDAMIEREIPDAIWDSHITAVQNYRNRTSSAGEPDTKTSPYARPPHNTTASDNFGFRLVKFGATDKRLKEMLAERNVPKEQWDSDIAIVRKYL